MIKNLINPAVTKNSKNHQILIYFESQSILLKSDQMSYCIPGVVPWVTIQYNTSCKICLTGGIYELIYYRTYLDMIKNHDGQVSITSF